MEREQEASADVAQPPRVPEPQAAEPMSRPHRGAPLPRVVAPVLAPDTAGVPGQRRTLEGGATHLVDRERPERTPPPSFETHQPGPPAGSASAVSAALARARTALGAGPSPALVEHAVELRVTVDGDGVVTSVVQGTGWTAAREGASAFMVAETVPPPVGARPLVEAVEGCTVGPAYVDLREGLFATRMELTEPVSLGDEVWSMHRVVPGGVVHRATSFSHRLAGPVGDVRLEVVFDSDHVPSSGSAFLAAGGGEVVVELPVVDGSLVWSGTATDACVVGLRWVW